MEALRFFQQLIEQNPLAAAFVLLFLALWVLGKFIDVFKRIAENQNISANNQQRLTNLAIQQDSGYKEVAAGLKELKTVTQEQTSALTIGSAEQVAAIKAMGDSLPSQLIGHTNNLAETFRAEVAPLPGRIEALSGKMDGTTRELVAMRTAIERSPDAVTTKVVAQLSPILGKTATHLEELSRTLAELTSAMKGSEPT